MKTKSTKGRGPGQKTFETLAHDGERWRHLVAAIIEQAINDYRLLKACRNKKLNETARRQLQELKEFFAAGGCMDRLIESAGLDIDPDFIRQQLFGIFPASEYGRCIAAFEAYLARRQRRPGQPQP